MFPDYNIYSLPLLILVIQGVVLSLLIFKRFVKNRRVADLVLAALILITCYHRTTYTIGFMGWYDTFRNTKINYYLISLTLAIGPLIYFYIKSSIVRDFHFKRKTLLHFLPVVLYVLFKMFVFLYDTTQPGFEETQNGPFYLWMMDYLGPLFFILFTIHLLVYLVFSFQLYFKYRTQLEEEYSNTYRYELRWLRNFLFLYTFLFVYDSIQNITEGLIVDLHWTQEWWYQFCSVLVVLYVGVMGYFTSMEGFGKIDLNKEQPLEEPIGETTFQFQDELENLKAIVENEKLYLDPNLTLSQLSRKSKINTSQLSFIINNGLQKNFNDFINEYRVAEVKTYLQDPSKKHLSILGIAYDCGFNSKATFNRVFKKIAGQSPSSFRK